MVHLLYIAVGVTERRFAVKKFNMLVLLVLVSLNANAEGTEINCEQTSKDDAMCLAIPSDSEARVQKAETVSANQVPAKIEATPVSMLDKSDLASAELDISQPTANLSKNLGLVQLQNTVQITDKLKDLYIFLNSNGIGGGNGDFKVSTSSKK